jgi:hypothetical protein
MSTLNEGRLSDSGESIAMLVAGIGHHNVVPVAHTYERERLLDLLACEEPYLLRGGTAYYKVRTRKGFCEVVLLPKNKY